MTLLHAPSMMVHTVQYTVPRICSIWNTSQLTTTTRSKKKKNNNNFYIHRTRCSRWKGSYKEGMQNYWRCLVFLLLWCPYYAVFHCTCSAKHERNRKPWLYVLARMRQIWFYFLLLHSENWLEIQKKVFVLKPRAHKFQYLPSISGLLRKLWSE